MVSELLIAVYQKYLEGDTLGLTNATTQNVNFLNQYGATGLHVDAYSRGALTFGNALVSVSNQPNAVGSLPSTTVTFFGAAFNAQQADNLLSNLQNRASVQDPAKIDAMTLVSWNHVADPVGILIGGNPGNTGVVPAGSSTAWEMLRAVTLQPFTSHNCYSSVFDGCGKLNGPKP